MYRTTIRHRHAAAIAAAAILIVVLAGSSAAVVNIRNETWTGPVAIPTESGATRVGVSFDADLTAADLSEGVRFKIISKDSNWLPEPLLTVVGYPGLPRGVWTASFEVSLSLSCDGQDGKVLPSDALCWIRYALPARGGELREFMSVRSLDAVKALGSFELYLWDDENVYSASSMRVDASQCMSDAGTIGIYFDPEGTTCQGTILPGSPGTVYVVAKPGATSMGLAAAEFRIGGVPGAWSAYPVANPGIITLGDPFGDGVTVGFPCHWVQQGPLVLYSVLILATAEVSDVEFSLRPRYPSSTPGFPCPLLVGCEPGFLKHCVESEPCFVNRSTPAPCAGPTAVSTRSWSTVKSLYRQPGR